MSEQNSSSEHVGLKKGTFAMPSKIYDVLKYVALIVLPAFATFYLTLGQTWGMPNTEQIATTTIAFSTFLGICLQVSKSSYDGSEKKYDGRVVVEEDEDGGQTMVIKDVDPSALVSKKDIAFKVNGPAR